MAKRAKPLKAPDKLVFLLSFVPYLLEQRVVDVAEAAQHFGMTEEEIRDAVRLIATSGLPGSTGTYQPNDLFDIDWDSFEDDDVIVIVHHVAIDDAPRLSAREAAALMAGLQYLSASPENAGSASLASLRAKLTAGASSAPSRLAVAETEADASLGLIREAVAEGRQLEFDYLNARGERGRRRVDPLRIISQDADWYLQACCHTARRRAELPRRPHERARAHRRADRRPLAIAPCPTPCSRARTPISTSSSTSRPATLPLLSDYLADSTTREVDGRMRVTLRLAHVHGLKRLVAGLPGLVTVVAPAEARAAVAEWAAAGLAGYSDREGAVPDEPETTLDD